MTWVHHPSPALLASAREVYEAAFPPPLRADFDTLLADTRLADTRLADELLVHGGGSSAPGLVVLRRLGDTGLVFVRYFVAGVRGRGVGTRMWHDLRTHLGPEVRVVLDVEHPDEPGVDAEEAEVRRRRVVFYERLGLAVLPLRDYLPPHDDHAPPMQLLATEVTGPDDARRVVLAAYEHRYGLPPGHPVVRRTLAASGLADTPE